MLRAASPTDSWASFETAQASGSQRSGVGTPFDVNAEIERLPGQARMQSAHPKRQNSKTRWVNVGEEERWIRPIVQVRCLNKAGEDVATRTRTSRIEVRTSELTWEWKEIMQLPLQPRARRSGLYMEFSISTGDEWQTPIASMRMPCRKVMNTPHVPVREALLWNQKKALKKRFAGDKAKKSDAPPQVFYAGELSVSVTYRKADPLLKRHAKSNKTAVSPILLPGQGVPKLHMRDHFEVVIRHARAIGDDGTNTETDNSVWWAMFAVLLFFAIGVVFYILQEKFSFVDALWFCVATFTTVGYGDVKPVTPAGMLFTAFYVLVGYILVGVAVGMLSAYIVDRQQRKHKMMIQRAQALAIGDDEEEEYNRIPVADNEDFDLDMSSASTSPEPTAPENSSECASTKEGTAAHGANTTQDGPPSVLGSAPRRRLEAAKRVIRDWSPTVIPVLIITGIGVAVMMIFEESTFIEVSDPSQLCSALTARKILCRCPRLRCRFFPMI